ncbi:MAG: hypothetical protein ACPGWR_09640 [Ardenticatenaceae bacterium]
MKLLSTTLSNSVQSLGQSFLVAFYLPALLFLLVHAYLLLPIWFPEAALSDAPTCPAGCVSEKSNTEESQPEKPEEEEEDEEKPPEVWFVEFRNDATSLLGALLLPLLGGIILLALNDYLIRTFEGQPLWLKYGLLYPFAKGNRDRSQQLYGDLVALQKEYRRVTVRLWESQSDDEKGQLERMLAGLTEQIRAEHNKIEQQAPVQTLPHDVERVTPTAFGNYYALAEEYAYERYGADAVLFWPRLNELMQDEAPKHAARLAQQKTSLDFALNLAFLSALLAFEAALTLTCLYNYGSPERWLAHQTPLWSLLAIGLLLFMRFYHSSVGAVYLLGELVKNSFDSYRGLILASFKLKTPDTLSVEQILWVRLAAFIRRGDEFYFPIQFKESDDSDDSDDSENEGKNKSKNESGEAQT